MFDEFDYSLDKGQDKSSQLKLKKLALIISVIFVFFLFFYIVINAYKFVMYTPAIEDISLIKAETNEIKVLSDSREKMKVDNLDIQAYDALDKKDNKLEVKGATKNPSSKKDLLDRLGVQDSQIKDNKAFIQSAKKEEKKKVAYKRAQIAALQTKESAIRYWGEQQSKYNSFLSDKVYFIEEADLGVKGVFYRLQVGDFDTIDEVREFCNQYTKITNSNKVSCIVVEVK